MITLLTDFGLSDVYVGVMKGAIAQINPTLNIIDITHQIPPQDIAAGRFCLMSAYPYFPLGTVHLAVVDPGVGSKRRAVAVEVERGFLVGPDNGLFSGILNQTEAIAAVELTNPTYWRTNLPSATFHGRDIFAPVAAHLASGVSIQQLGHKIDVNSLVQLPIGSYSQTATGVIGCIQYIDYFGNLISNIPGAVVQDKVWSIKAANLTISGTTTYSNTPIGSAIALVGSHSWVEIAIYQGNAKEQLQLNLGDRLEIVYL